MGIDDRHLPVRNCWYCPLSGGPLRALFALEGRMRGYHDEMGGPESVAGSEWGRGVGMTAAGLPASPGVGDPRARGAAEFFARLGEGESFSGALSALLSDSPSEDTLRHNFLLRRQLNDPGYGASRGFDWRESALAALGVEYVDPAPMLPSEARRLAAKRPPSE